MSKPKYDFDLIVIGSGAGGSIAADIVASTGKKVALVEGDTLGGECPNWGCVPSKALLHVANIYDQAKNSAELGIRGSSVGYNYPSVKTWKDLAVKRTGAAESDKYYHSRGIALYRGRAHFISAHQITINRRHLSAAHFLIATGSNFALPLIEGLAKTPYLTARTALDLNRPPKSIFIVGAGAVGAEFAELLSIFGTKVYLADIAPRILPSEDDETSRVIEHYFQKKRGMTLLTKSKVLKVSREGLTTKVTYQRGGESHTVKVDQLMIAAGKQPNVDLGLENAGVDYTAKGIEVNQQLQTSAPHIFAAGDVIGRHMYTHMGVYESRVAAHNLLAKNKVSVDYRAVPRVTFVTPEVASVGLSEADCMKRDLKTRIGLAPVNIIGRSNVANMRDGFCKVITDRKGMLIGATVVAPHAGEVIHELALAIQYGMTASQVANTLHAFPTWSEVVRVACAKIKV
ncbi:MAG TPA: NAD(P)/FAD-dependent oxidoreductase [Candidatus Saccharimonadales bacterium]|nr:NAD(P)/FAD-dependent oxidoreductase [Candidatus Saccharimonadales bacterium]